MEREWRCTRRRSESAWSECARGPASPAAPCSYNLASARAFASVPKSRSPRLLMSRIIRILLADDHAVVRQGFKLILNQESDMEVVGEASEGEETVRLTQQLRPHVVIMDIAMPRVNGLEATRRIVENHPESKVLILSMHKDAVYVRETLRAGAKGYLLKESIDHDLLRAIRAVAQGDGFLSPEISNTVLQDYQQVEDPF